MVWDRGGCVGDLQVASASDIECVFLAFFGGDRDVDRSTERKALEQSLIDEEDEEEEEDTKYLNLEGEDDGEFFSDMHTRT